MLLSLLLALAPADATAGTWDNVDLPETLEEIMTVEFAHVTVTAQQKGGSVTFKSQQISAGQCAEGEHRGGLRYEACYNDGGLQIDVSGGEVTGVSATISSADGTRLFSGALTEAGAEAQTEQRRVTR